MSSARISDAEAHELVMKRWETRTREEWQKILDDTAEKFGRKNSAEGAMAYSPASGKPGVRANGCRGAARTAGQTSNDSQPRPAKAIKKKASLPIAQR